MARRIRVGTVSDFPAGELTPVEVDGQKVVVARDDEGLCAAKDKCPHLGLSLTARHGAQSYTDGVVTCPWHMSKFVVRSGENLDWAAGVAGREVPRWSRRLLSAGRKPAPLTTYPVVVEGEDVFVEM